MAKYTIELRKVCDLYGREEVENWFKDYDVDDFLLPEFALKIAQAGVWSKDRLARKIVDHYYMREIGLETPALFKHYAKVKMQELMEKYLMVIYTNCIEYDPFESVDFHITESRTINNSNETTGTSTSNSNGSGLVVNSNTPQGQINKNNILSGAYASNTSANESDVTATDNTNSTSSGTTIESFRHDEKGNRGVLDSYQKMILQLRDTIYAVDAKIIEELNELFMGIY